jgi:hypothetical protein
MKFSQLCPTCGKPIEAVYATTGLCETCWSVQCQHYGCPGAFKIAHHFRPPAETKNHDDDDFESVQQHYTQAVDRIEQQHRAEEQQHKAKRRWIKARAV